MEHLEQYQCPTCGKYVTLTKHTSGLRVHGPRNARCPGSGSFPALVCTAPKPACTHRYSGCTFDGVLVEDPYEKDVNETPGVMIIACEHCLQQLKDDI